MHASSVFCIIIEIDLLVDCTSKHGALFVYVWRGHGQVFVFFLFSLRIRCADYTAQLIFITIFFFHSVSCGIAVMT